MNVKKENEIIIVALRWRQSRDGTRHDLDEKDTTWKCKSTHHIGEKKSEVKRKQKEELKDE